MQQSGQAAWITAPILAVALAGCALQPSAAGEKDRGEDSGAAAPGSRFEGGEGEAGDPDGGAESGPAEDPNTRSAENDFDWEGGAVETTTQSGVTFSVPGVWQRFPDQDTGDGEEAVYLWEEGSARYGESIVFNTGGAGEPSEGIDVYLDFLLSLDVSGDEIDPGEAQEVVEVPGTDDATRVDYTYSLAGVDGDAHGVIVGFTATTGDVVLFVVSGDGVNATEELSEEIISTLSVGAPPEGGV